MGCSNSKSQDAVDDPLNDRRASNVESGSAARKSRTRRTRTLSRGSRRDVLVIDDTVGGTDTVRSRQGTLSTRPTAKSVLRDVAADKKVPPVPVMTDVSAMGRDKQLPTPPSLASHEDDNKEQLAPGASPASPDAKGDKQSFLPPLPQKAVPRMSTDGESAPEPRRALTLDAPTIAQIESGGSVQSTLERSATMSAQDETLKMLRQGTGIKQFHDASSKLDSLLKRFPVAEGTGAPADGSGRVEAPASNRGAVSHPMVMQPRVGKSSVKSFETEHEDASSEDAFATPRKQHPHSAALPNRQAADAEGGDDADAAKTHRHPHSARVETRHRPHTISGVPRPALSLQEQLRTVLASGGGLKKTPSMKLADGARTADGEATSGAGGGRPMITPVKSMLRKTGFDAEAVRRQSAARHKQERAKASPFEKVHLRRAATATAAVAAAEGPKTAPVPASFDKSRLRRATTSTSTGASSAAEGKTTVPIAFDKTRLRHATTLTPAEKAQKSEGEKSASAAFDKSRLRRTTTAGAAADAAAKPKPSDETSASSAFDRSRLRRTNTDLLTRSNATSDQAARFGFGRRDVSEAASATVDTRRTKLASPSADSRVRTPQASVRIIGSKASSPAEKDTPDYAEAQPSVPTPKAKVPSRRSSRSDNIESVHSRPTVSPSPDSMNRRLPRKQQNTAAANAGATSGAGVGAGGAHQNAIADLALSAKLRREQFDKMRESASPQAAARVEQVEASEAAKVAEKQGDSGDGAGKDSEFTVSVQNPEAALSDEDIDQENCEDEDTISSLPSLASSFTVTLDVPTDANTVGRSSPLSAVPPTPREFDFASAVAEQLAEADDGDDMTFSLIKEELRARGGVMTPKKAEARHTESQDAAAEDSAAQESKEVAEFEVVVSELEKRSKDDAAQAEVEGSHYISPAPEQDLSGADEAAEEVAEAPETPAPIFAELGDSAAELVLQENNFIGEEPVSPDAISERILSTARTGQAPEVATDITQSPTAYSNVSPTSPQPHSAPLPTRSTGDFPSTLARINLPPIPKSDRKRSPASQRLPTTSRAKSSTLVDRRRCSLNGGAAPATSTSTTHSHVSPPTSLHRRHVRALSQIPESSIRRSPTSNEKISLPPLPAVIGNRRRPRRQQQQHGNMPYMSRTLTLPLEFGIMPSPMSASSDDAAPTRRPKHLRAKSLTTEGASLENVMSGFSSDENEEKFSVPEFMAPPAAPVVDPLKSDVY